MANEAHRARTIEEFRDGQRKFHDAACAVAESTAPFRPRPGDIVISPYGKCGTTMLQQIFHTLRTGGDCDFDDISRVVPWIEMSPLLGIDLNAEQRAEPRGFKSHLSHARVPKGARYVVTLRDPKDAFVSMFRFMEGWFIEPGAIPIEQFFERWLIGRGPEGGGYWDHLLSWWAVREQPDVLLLSYARVVADRARHIRMIAEFAGIPLDQQLLDLAVERSSRDWMLAHKNLFDDAMIRELSETLGGMPRGSDSAKVRASPSISHKDELPPPIGERIDAVWSERVTPVTGHADFAAMEADL